MPPHPRHRIAPPAHLGDEDLNRVEDVAVNDPLKGGELVLRVPRPVDDLHLLEDGALARLARAKQEHLSLTLRAFATGPHHLIDALVDRLLSLSLRHRLGVEHICRGAAAHHFGGAEYAARAANRKLPTREVVRNRQKVMSST